MKKEYLGLIFILGLHLLLLTNLQFTAWPEMFSYPYLRNHDFLIYKDMIHPYPPLLTMFLSVIYKVFGYGLPVLQYTTWIMLLLNTFLIFIIIRSFSKKIYLPLLGSGLYSILQPFLEGNMLWFDTAIVTPLLLTFYALIKYIDEKKLKYLFLTGMFLCISILIKQTVGIYLISLCLLFLFQKLDFKKWTLFFSPFFLLGVPLLVRLLQEGAFGDFINWTLLYPLTLWSKFPGYVQMALSKKEALTLTLFLLPITLLITNFKNFGDKKIGVMLIFLLCSLVAIYPRFSFFHFQAALAFFIIFSLYITREYKKEKLFAGGLIFLSLIGVLLYKQGMLHNWNKQARFYEQKDIELAKKINAASNKDDRIFFLGLPSQLYLMSNRLPSKRWTDNYVWYLDISGVQEEILYRWEVDPPKTIFFQRPKDGNWFDLGTYQPKKIVEYIKLNYNFEREIAPGVELWQRKS